MQPAIKLGHLSPTPVPHSPHPAGNPPASPEEARYLDAGFRCSGVLQRLGVDGGYIHTPRPGHEGGVRAVPASPSPVQTSESNHVPEDAPLSCSTGEQWPKARVAGPELLLTAVTGPAAHAFLSSLKKQQLAFFFFNSLLFKKLYYSNNYTFT